MARRCRAETRPLGIIRSLDAQLIHQHTNRYIAYLGKLSQLFHTLGIVLFNQLNQIQQIFVFFVRDTSIAAFLCQVLKFLFDLIRYPLVYCL